ncbi:MAG: efflux RND transporter periplasmic adaptor subunit [Roseiarcus sp.]
MSGKASFAAAFAAAVLLSGCHAQRASEANPVRPVLSTVVAQSSANALTLAGSVQPRIETEFSFRVLGRLIARPVNVGDLVQQGQTLAAIDPIALELAVKAAAADLSNAQAQLANAAGVEERQRALLTTSATTQAGYDAAQQGLAAAQANLTRADAALAKTREQLGYAVVKSDFAGVVTAVGAEVGQVVSPGRVVVSVAQPDLRDAVVDVPDNLAQTLSLGTRFVVSLQLNRTIQVGGSVREIAPEADPATRTRRVKIALDSPPDTFRLGSTIAASPASGSAPVMRLPASALLEKDGRTQVWIVDPKSATVSLREVKVTADDDRGVIVLSGLEPAMRVVTAGVHRLAVGQAVKIDEGSAP